MSYKVYHEYDDSWVDISDYVISEPEIPCEYRNRNYEPIAEGTDFEVSWAYDNGFSKGDSIKVENGSDTAVFSGFVYKVTKKYEDRKISLTIKSDLYALSQINIEEDTLKSAIFIANSGGAINVAVVDGETTDFDPDYLVTVSHGLSSGAAIFFDTDGQYITAYVIYYVKYIDDNSFYVYSDSDLSSPVTYLEDIAGGGYYVVEDLGKVYEDRVQVLHAITVMFSESGLTLDTTGMSDSLVGNFIGGVTTKTFHMDDFSILFDDLWWINQSDDADSDDNEIDDDSLITYWDFISVFFAMTSSTIKQTGEKEYQIVREGNEVYSVDDDNICDQYDESEIKADYTGFQYSLTYHGDDIDTLNTGTGSISWYNNYVLYFGQANEGETQNNTKWLPSKANVSNVRVGLEKYSRALTSDYTEREYQVLRLSDNEEVYQNKINISQTSPFSTVVEEEY